MLGRLAGAHVDRVHHGAYYTTLLHLLSRDSPTIAAPLIENAWHSRALHFHVWMRWHLTRLFVSQGLLAPTWPL